MVRASSRATGALVVLLASACGPAKSGSSGGASESSGTATTGTSTGEPEPTSTTGQEPGGTGSAGGTSSTGDGVAETGSSTTTTGVGATGTTGADTSGTAGTSGGDSSGGSSGGGVGEPADCPQTEFGECAPFDCDKVECGGLFNAIGEDGELRTTCTPETCSCAAGSTCFQQSAWGGCVASKIGCDFQTEDCGGAYCVPDELQPPPFACGGTEESSCVAAGCTFAMTPFMVGAPGKCTCGPAAPSCLWFPNKGAEEPGVTAYYHAHVPGDVRLFPAKWSAPPWPWKLCAGDPDAPPECGCEAECAP